MAIALNRLFDLGFTADNVRLPVQPASARSDPEPGKRKSTVLAGGALFALAGTGSLLPLVGLLIILVLGAGVMDFLRKRQNPTYWQAACWFLVALGILARQLLAPNHRLDVSQLCPSLVLASAIISLAVFPILMRRLNKLASGPGLMHVALPFSLGFFLDYAQVLTSHFIVHLPWVTKV